MVVEASRVVLANEEILSRETDMAIDMTRLYPDLDVM